MTAMTERYQAEDVLCGFCGHVTRAYKRRIHKEMVRFLDRLAAVGGHATSRSLIGGTKASTDASYLVLWGLVRRPKRGEYELTLDGWAFVKGLSSAPAFAVVRGMRAVRWSAESVYAAEFREPR